MLKFRALSQQLTAYLRLRTLPVGFRFFEKKDDLKQIKNIRKLPNNLKTCQMISLARVNGWTIGAALEDCSDTFCPAYLGLREREEHVLNGTFRNIAWFEDRKDALKCEQMMPTIPPGKFEAIAVAPLGGEKFDPDVVLLYSTPAQIILLINAIQWKDYEPMLFHCVGESACNDSLVRCYLTGKPQLGLPSYGERLYAAVQEEELVMGLPPDMLEKVLKGLKGLYSRGIRYPIPCIAPQADPTTGMPEEYIKLGKK